MHTHCIVFWAAFAIFSLLILFSFSCFFLSFFYFARGKVLFYRTHKWLSRAFVAFEFEMEWLTHKHFDMRAMPLYHGCDGFVITYKCGTKTMWIKSDERMRQSKRKREREREKRQKKPKEKTTQTRSSMRDGPTTKANIARQFIDYYYYYSTIRPYIMYLYIRLYTYWTASARTFGGKLATQHEQHRKVNKRKR